MGMFKDMKGMVDVYRSDDLKELRRTAAAAPKTSMMDALKTGNQAIADAQQWQGQNAANPMPMGMGAPAGAAPAAGMGAYATGTPASATVQSIMGTGAMVNGAPVIDFQLMVTVPGQAPYPATLRQPINPVQMPHFQPGATFPVHVDQNDPSSVVMG